MFRKNLGPDGFPHRTEAQATYAVSFADEREAQIRELVELRRKAGALIDADRDGAEDANAKRAALKRAYTAFRKAHGPIGDSFGITVLRKLRDPFAGMLQALENRDGAPAAIMDRPTVRAARRLDNPSIRDAYIMARNESVTLDLDRIAALARKPSAAGPRNPPPMRSRTEKARLPGSSRWSTTSSAR